MATKSRKRRSGKLKRPVRTKKGGKRRCRKTKRKSKSRKSRKKIKSYKMDYQGPRGFSPPGMTLTKIKSYMDNLQDRDAFCDTVSKKIRLQYERRVQDEVERREQLLIDFKEHLFEEEEEEEEEAEAKAKANEEWLEEWGWEEDVINIVEEFMRNRQYAKYRENSMYKFLILLFIPFYSNATQRKVHDYLNRLVALIDECVKENVFVIELEVRASVLTQFLYKSYEPPRNSNWLIASMLNESFFAEAMRLRDSRHFYINGAVPKSGDVFQITPNGDQIISYELKRTLHYNAKDKFYELIRTNEKYGKPLVNELVSVELGGTDRPYNNNIGDTPTIIYKIYEIFNYRLKKYPTRTIRMTIPSYEFLYPLITIALERPFFYNEFIIVFLKNSSFSQYRSFFDKGRKYK